MAVYGTLFTFAMTALGASAVFFFRKQISARVGRICFGFAGGVMSAAAVFSLIMPAMERLGAMGGMAGPVIACGFGLGACLMMALDLWMEHRQTCPDEASRRRAMLMSAVTLHNIPEGLAVGLAFAQAAGSQGAIAAAGAVALGIGIQNIPEGAAIALPMHQGGMSRKRSFAYGALSGAVEPLAGVIAALSASLFAGVAPVLMAFSAGAMMWVVFSEMLPEAGAKRDGAVAAALGYLLMMALDIMLG